MLFQGLRCTATGSVRHLALALKAPRLPTPTWAVTALTGLGLIGSFVVVTELQLAPIKMELRGIADLTHGMAGIRADLRQDMAEIRADWKQDMAGLRADWKHDMAEIRTRRHFDTFFVVGTMVATLVVMSLRRNVSKC